MAPARNISWLAVACLVAHAAAAPTRNNERAANITDYTSLVRMFIGTVKGGHVFPGATTPNGMVKAGMDTDSPERQAGYDGNLTYKATGFSQLHDSGTGGGASLSNFKLWPYADCADFSTCHTSLSSRKVGRQVLPDGSSPDRASPGYFASNLSTGIQVELTSTRRTAVHRYTFPPNTPSPRILIDVGNDGMNSCTKPSLTIDPVTGRVKGGGNFQASFGPGRYNAFFCADFRGEGYNTGPPTQYGAYSGDYASANTTALSQLGQLGREYGSLSTFKPNPSGTTSIIARVGISLISVDQACSNAEQEVPDFNFEGTHQANRELWNELLGRIAVDTTGVDEETVALFYSSLYRTHIVPADYTGENPKWKSNEPYFDSLYCNWDTYRTLYPVYALHDPLTFARVSAGLIDIWRNEGWLPECRGATVQQYIQGGSNSDPILGEFFVKYGDYAAKLGISVDDLYKSLVQDAENQPTNWDLQGRQTNLWKQYGYLPTDIYEQGGTNTRQVSRALEYAYNDFNIAQVAKLLNKTEDAAKYHGRAANFAKNWNPAVSIEGHNGMMQPLLKNGSFGFTDPRHCSIHDPTHSTCYLDAGNHDGFYEDSPLVYSQYVPHDTAKLIELQGGVDEFVSRLDFIFEQGYFDATNEPSQQMPFMYNYANQPSKTTLRAREVIGSTFNTSINGLPGNDDSGAMGSFVVSLMLGLYPVPGTRQLLLSSPWFSKVSFFNPLFNKTTTISTTGFEGNPAPGATGNIFVKSVTVDGKAWKSACYLDWDVFSVGSSVVLELTDDASATCGMGSDALPPSLSTGGFT
ncbi:glycoside hydrolase family 92 protein [Botryobasidium botryosum FD-172 SS1]|uniref:Glycoside hydrolase family 92 protein n=1 Tax=Botryobasidium botryosum (strain FD-172 SS1) TaxID=930990 RepID=A0A067N5K6_BOTB1|nr:glycoside hydrolase family 92 protein [Botryobasidium botryosum FD-172 SS1]